MKAEVQSFNLRSWRIFKHISGQSDERFKSANKNLCGKMVKLAVFSLFFQS